MNSMIEGEMLDIMGRDSFFGIKDIETFFGPMRPEDKKKLEIEPSLSQFFSRQVLEACKDEFMLVAYPGFTPRQIWERYIVKTVKKISHRLSFDLYHPDRLDERWGAFWYLIRKTPLPNTGGMDKESFGKMVPALNQSMELQDNLTYGYTPYSMVVFWVWWIRIILNGQDSLLSPQQGILTGDNCLFSCNEHIKLSSLSEGSWMGQDDFSRGVREKIQLDRSKGGVLPIIYYP